MKTIVPAADVAYRTPEDRAVLVYLRKWSQDPVLLAKNIVVVMVTESLAELDPKLVRSHSTREIEIVRPDPAERLAYLQAVRSPEWYAGKSDLPPQRLAELTAGMTRVQIGQLLEGTDANGDHLTRERVRAMKKEVIETEGLGLGLSIVAAIAKAHHATLAISPEPNGGLSIDVSFTPATATAPHQRKALATA